MSNVKGFKFNPITGDATITKSFAKRMSNPYSEEYILVQIYKQDNPNMRLLQRTIEKSGKYRLGYISETKMLRYIGCQDSAVELLKEFLEQKELSKSLPHPIEHLRKWFFTKFPGYVTLAEINISRMETAEDVQETTPQSIPVKKETPLKKASGQ
ncbi:hypothetical protein LJC56_04355 [Christensenellaceae bacterium OttesenSCG-928-K19]|nr:hypothetical protein [Christensenellaceae bacterium OttesenSCG-928-K19]